MLNNNLNNKSPLRLRAAGSKLEPHLSLNLHTMPQTVGSHFLKWLFLGLLVFGLMVLIAFLIFWP